MAEDKLERKLASVRKDYYGDVLTALCGVSSVLILGPGEAKGELVKQMQAKKVRGLAVELKTADKMTDRQLAAKVRFLVWLLTGTAILLKSLTTTKHRWLPGVLYLALAWIIVLAIRPVSQRVLFAGLTWLLG